MNDGNSPQGTGGGASAELNRDEIHSALFAQMVMQQSNLALMLLGRTPHPETGQPVRDLEAAKLFIDQLEMLEVKTKGNLKPQESALIKQSLMTLRLAFVEAVNAPETPPPAAKPTAAAEKDSPAAENKTAPAEATSGVGEEESRKRFSKKYSG